MTLISAYCGIEEIRGAHCPESTLTEENFSHYSASCTHVVSSTAGKRLSAIKSDTVLLAL